MFYRIKKKIRMYQNENKILKKAYLFGNYIKVKGLSRMSDEKFAKLKYKENTGKVLNLENPRTYNEKLWWLKINNRDPLLTICSDKYKVREYVKDCGLEHILTRLYGVYSNENIDFSKLPDKAFIKCNHGSGANALYYKDKSFNVEKFKKKFNFALKQNYYLQSREWNYKNIEPKIIVEEVIEDDSGAGLVDYRFLCFDGNVKLILVDINTASPDGTHNPYAKRNVYDKEFNLLDLKFGRDNFDPLLIQKPKNLDKMIKYAEILSEPFPHCRVDLYNVNGTIYFGEITFYHGGGTQYIEPQEWEIKIGDWIDLSSDKVKLG